MQKLLFGLGLFELGLIAGLFTSSAGATTVTMVCDLRGAQEVPVIVTAARGCGTFTIDTVANTLSFRVVFGGLGSAETMAHIHGPAGPGANAGIMFNLPLGNPKVGVWNYDEAWEADILAGRMYVNIHTMNNTGGEIRGQINHFAAALDGDQENPAIAIGSRGWATFNIDTCANTLAFHIAVESLGSAETMAHIHGASLPGVNAGILFNLPLGAVKTGVWNYPEALEPAILNGLMYVNVHTMNNTGGEIRGQIVNSISPLDGAQETPPAATPAIGCGYVAFDRPANALGFYITYSGLTTPETMAHIHGFSPPGMASGIQLNLPATNPKKGSWVYGGVRAANVFDGLSYFNIHTIMFTAGEIRGQIVPAAPRCASDVNCDGVTNVDDLLGVIGGWGPCSAAPAPCPADTDYSGNVNVDDLLRVITGWGPCA